MPRLLPIAFFFIACCALSHPSSVMGQGPNSQKPNDQPSPAMLKAHQENYRLTVKKLEDEEKKAPGANRAYGLHVAIIAAELAGMETQAKKHKEELLLLNQNTVFECYLRKTEGWKGVTQILKDRYCDSANTFDEEQIARLGKAYEAMTREYVIAPSDKETILLGFLLGVLKEIKPEHLNPIASTTEGKAIRILSQKGISDKEKFFDLEEKQSPKSVEKFKAYLYEKKLKEEERRSPLVAKTAARSYLQLGQYDKAASALQLIEKIEEKPDLAYLLATALSQKQEYERGAEVLKSAIGKLAAGESSDDARQLLDLLEHASQYRAKADTLCSQSIKALAAKMPQSIALKFSGVIPGKGSVECYARADALADAMEVVLLVKRKPVLAYRADHHGTTYFFADSPNIKQLSSRGLVMQFNLTPKTAEKMGTFAYFTTAQGQGAVKKSVDAIAGMLLQQGSFLESPLESMHKSAPFLVSDTKESPMGKEFSMKTPRFTSEGFETLQFTFDKKHLPQKAVWKDITVEVLSWDAAEGEKLVADAWPKLPFTTIGQFGTAEMMQMFGTAMSIIGDLYAETTKMKL